MKKLIGSIAIMGSTLASHANAAWTDLLPKFLKSDELVFIEYCEATLKERLKAPTTYTRIDYGFRQVTATPEQVIYFDQEVNEKNRYLIHPEFQADMRKLSAKQLNEWKERGEKITKEMIAISKQKYLIPSEFEKDKGSYERCAVNFDCPYRGLAIVKYTAENTFGAPLADYMECVVNYKSSLSEVQSSDIYVNGYTRKQWISHLIDKERSKALNELLLDK